MNPVKPSPIEVSLMTLSEKIAKRSKEIETSLEIFLIKWNAKETASPIHLIEGSARKVAEKYFELSENVIKKYLPPNSFSNKYKVAAGSEIAVMHILPFNFEDPNFTLMQRREINALFAIELAISILLNIQFESKDEVKLNPVNPALGKILSNHKLWLSRLNTKDISIAPTFIDSNFWEAYFYCLTGEFSSHG